MKKKINTNYNQFNELKRIGFEFNNPQDEFSYQPDSGSTANGKIGEQENGIDIDSDAQTYVSTEFGEAEGREDPKAIILGESSWSQERRLPEDEISNRDNSGEGKVLTKIVNPANLKARDLSSKKK